MKILVLNSGSSSVKYKLIETEGAEAKTLAEGGVEKIGLESGFLKYKRPDGTKETDHLGLIDHQQAVESILAKLTAPVDGCIKTLDEISKLPEAGEIHFKEHNLIIADCISDLVKP